MVGFGAPTIEPNAQGIFCMHSIDCERADGSNTVMRGKSTAVKRLQRLYIIVALLPYHSYLFCETYHQAHQVRKWITGYHRERAQIVAATANLKEHESGDVLVLKRFGMTMTGHIWQPMTCVAVVLCTEASGAQRNRLNFKIFREARPSNAVTKTFAQLGNQHTLTRIMAACGRSSRVFSQDGPKHAETVQLYVCEWQNESKR